MLDRIEEKVMNLLELFQRYQDNDDAIAYLESIRWKDGVICTKCHSDKTCRHDTKNRQKKWQCWNCHHSFSVTVGTIFHHTHIPLNKWFWLISLMLNAKKGLSACQAARDLGMRRPTVWSMMHRIRKAMETDQANLLKGIVEMDECYIGGKPRKENKKDDDNNDDEDKPKRGRGTKKIPVIGMVEREGKVKVSKSLSKCLGANDLLAFKGNNMFDNITWPVGIIGLAETFQKFGKELFKNNWTSAESSQDEILSIFSHSELSPAAFLVYGDHIASLVKNSKEQKKIMKKARAHLTEVFYDSFKEKGIALKDKIQECEDALGKHLLYKEVLKIGHIESIQQHERKVLIRLIEFLLRHATIFKLLESLIFSRQLTPSIRIKKTGIEKEIPKYCLSCTADSRLRFKVQSSECFFYDLQDEDNWRYEEGFLFFKEEDVKKTLLHLKQSANSISYSDNLDDAILMN